MNLGPIELWLFAFLVRGVVIALVWCFMGWALHRLSAGRISAWWRGGILALLVIAILPPDTAILRIPLAGSFRETPPAPLISDVVPTPDAIAIVPVAWQSPPPAPTLAWWIWVWLAGATVLGIRLLVSHLRVAQILRAAVPITDPAVIALLPDAARARRVELRTHPDIQSPFASGWFRRIIVLPESGQSLPDELQMMIRHEWAHFRRGDIAWQLVSEVMTALHWPNPLTWIFKRRLRFSQEAAADDEVLSGGFDGPAYATLLLAAATQECRLAREAVVVPMARISTLRHRIGLLLDGTRSRAMANPVLRYGMTMVACVAAVALGFGGLRAEPDHGDDGRAETWSRKYQDTLRLEKTFAERFPGTSAEALDAFRKELAARQVTLSDSVGFKLSSDKGTLVIEFSDSDRRAVESTLLEMMTRAGWWQDPMELRRRSAEQVLAPLREKVSRFALKMTVLREAGRIIDPDPESADATIATEDPDTVEAERQLREVALRLTKAREQDRVLSQLKSGDVRAALKVLHMEDIVLSRMEDSLQDALVERLKLRTRGHSDQDAEVKAVQSQIDEFERNLSDAFISIRNNQVTLIEIERRSLAELERRYKEAANKQVENKSRVGEYLNAKAQYLQSKALYQAIELKQSN